MNLIDESAVVWGGGGFIGRHLVKNLLAGRVNVVRAVDVKPLDAWYQVSPLVENLLLDLKDKESCHRAAKGVKVVFQLAADRCGLGFGDHQPVGGSCGGDFRRALETHR